MEQISSGPPSRSSFSAFLFSKCRLFIRSDLPDLDQQMKPLIWILQLVSSTQGLSNPSIMYVLPSGFYNGSSDTMKSSHLEKDGRSRIHCVLTSSMVPEAPQYSQLYTLSSPIFLMSMFALHLGHETPDDIAFSMAKSEDTSSLREPLGTFFRRFRPSIPQYRNGTTASRRTGKTMATATSESCAIIATMKARRITRAKKAPMRASARSAS